MQPKLSSSDQTVKPPSPLLVVLASLFGYPGAGQLLLARRREAAFFAALFTITLGGMLYEIWQILPDLYSLLRQAIELQDLSTADMPVPDLRRVALWFFSSTALWLLSALHGGWVAARADGSATVSSSHVEPPTGPSRTAND